MDVTITSAELDIMRVLWIHSPLNARQVSDRLTDKDWHRKTVNTLLSRLEKKSAISVQKHQDGISYFTPLVDQESYQKSAASELVDSLFGGQIAPLIACFAKDRPLTDTQISELREILEELADDND